MLLEPCSALYISIVFLATQSGGTSLAGFVINTAGLGAGQKGSLGLSTCAIHSSVHASVSDEHELAWPASLQTLVMPAQILLNMN